MWKGRGKGRKTEREREIEESNLITDFFRAIDTILFLVLNFEFEFPITCVNAKKVEERGEEDEREGAFDFRLRRRLISAEIVETREIN